MTLNSSIEKVMKEFDEKFPAESVGDIKELIVPFYRKEKIQIFLTSALKEIGHETAEAMNIGNLEGEVRDEISNAGIFQNGWRAARADQLRRKEEWLKEV